MKVIMGNSMV